MFAKIKNAVKTKVKNNDMARDYSKIYPYVKPYLFRAVLAIVITLPIGAMDAVIAWVLKPFMDIVMIEKSAKTVSLLPVLIIVFALTQSLLNYAAIYLNSWVGTRITMDLKRTLFKKLLRSDPSFFDKTSSGDVLFRFNADADMACAGLLSNLKLFTTRLFSSISLIFVLIYNSWLLSILAIFILFMALFPLASVRRKIKGLMDKSVVSGAMVMTHYNEAFAGNRVNSSFNLYNYQSKRFDESLKFVFKLAMKMIKRTGLLTPMMHFIISIGIAGVIWLGSYLIVNNQLTPGGFVSFITALLMLYHPIKSIGTNYTNIQMSLLAMERVFELIEREPLIKNRKNSKILQGIEKGVSFSNVSFEYEKGRPVLRNVSLDVKKGQTIAFVGNSGGGKSTLVSLLPRFYDVKEGAIAIDGVDIRDIEIDSLRKQIAVVFQDNILFNGTIRDNILLGKENASKEEIQASVHNACLDEFISSLEKGLDTEIGERGVKLSGGQKQRVAIARAFIKDAPIVVLDEATSALDNKSESIVQQAIYNLMADRTVFIIAHRLSTVKNADKILVVDHGEIVEMGTHAELVNKPDSIYASLYNTQLR